MTYQLEYNSKDLQQWPTKVLDLQYISIAAVTTLVSATRKEIIIEMEIIPSLLRPNPHLRRAAGMLGIHNRR
jgi:hypothetical protein